jgi:hypothetical protein
LFRIEREVFGSGVRGVLKVDIDLGQESLFLSTNAVLFYFEQALPSTTSY